MNKRVLAIDDERMNLLILKNVLKNFDLTLITAESGKLGIDYHRENKFDLILTDYNMPSLNGVQTSSIIRENDKSKNMYTPIILITAIETKSILEWKEYSFDEVLFKPIDIDLLKAVVKQYLYEGN